jgi:D-alanine-D-alanine ligase
MPKLKVGVLFGGRSAEHEVSLVSATSVMNSLDKNKYEIIPIAITPEGKWLSSADSMKLLKEKSPTANQPEQILLPNPQHRGIVNNSAWVRQIKPVDVIFPALHGTYGEDGTIQGLFELADIPYVGAGVLGSSVGMDKVVQKELLKHAGIPTAPSVWFTSSEFRKNQPLVLQTIEKSLGYPMFIKPPNAGSSIGITKAHNRKELIAGLGLAAQYDRKILVEDGIKNAREIECSVLGNDTPGASVLGEIVSSNEFYDYDAKYVDGKSKAVIPAKLPPAVAKKIRAFAVSAFRVLDCSGMARVDFLVQKKTNKIFLNEINTIPGFTSISMYPKLWEASGIPYSALLDRLIELALERHAEKKLLRTTYQPKKDWYKE